MWELNTKQAPEPLSRAGRMTGGREREREREGETDTQTHRKDTARRQASETCRVIAVGGFLTACD